MNAVAIMQRVMQHEDVKGIRFEMTKEGRREYVSFATDTVDNFRYRMFVTHLLDSYLPDDAIVKTILDAIEAQHE